MPLERRAWMIEALAVSCAAVALFLFVTVSVWYIAWELRHHDER